MVIQCMDDDDDEDDDDDDAGSFGSAMKNLFLQFLYDDMAMVAVS